MTQEHQEQRKCCKRPKKVVIRADEKTPSLRDFFLLFPVFLPGLRLDSEVLFI